MLRKHHLKLGALCLLGILINGLIFGPALQLTWRGINDFMNIYSGTHLAFTDGMYDVPSNLHVMKQAAGWENVNRLYNRPPFYALFLWPLGRLPYLAASHVWELLVLGAIAAFWFLWPGDRKTAGIACCWSLPLFYVFANGQDVGILLVLITLAIRLMRSGNQTAAGLIFSLCSIKFHLFLLLPLLIVRERRWRLLGGLTAGGVLLTLLSFLPGGWNWPVTYLRLLLNPIGFPWPNLMPGIHGMTSTLPHAGIWEIAGIALVALLAWRAIGRGGFEYGLAAVLAGGILVAPHVYLSDCAIALPALLITLPHVASAWQRNVHLFLLSPVCYIWSLTGPGWITGIALLSYLALLATGFATVRSPGSLWRKSKAPLDGRGSLESTAYRAVTVRERFFATGC